MELRQEGFWDNHYELELRNYEDGGDEGDVWFGKSLSRRISDWVVDRLLSSSSNSRILDVGCGNAFTLRTILHKYEDRSGHELASNHELLGIDFSSNSIELSRKILKSSALDGRISLCQCDFLDHKQVERACGEFKYDFIIDKGTYDAICLLASNGNLEETRSKYMKSIYSLVRDKSIFILASCNYTEEELMKLFQTSSAINNITSKLIGKIDSPKFQFGGQEGSQVCCLIMEFYEEKTDCSCQ